MHGTEREKTEGEEEEGEEEQDEKGEEAVDVGEERGRYSILMSRCV